MDATPNPSSSSTQTNDPARPDAAQPASQSSNTDASLHDQVATIMERIRPAVQMDGGDVELVEVTDQGVVKLRLHGACVGCPSSSITLKMGIERTLKEHLPQVSTVEQVV